MIILHSHLQPQFKNELFHILHKKRNVRKSNSFKCAGSPSLHKQPFLLALRFAAEDVLRGMSEKKRLFSQAKGALALRKFLQVRTLVPEVSLEIFVCERESKPRLAVSFAKKKQKNQENLWDQGINYNVI